MYSLYNNSLVDLVCHNNSSPWQKHTTVCATLKAYFPGLEQGLPLSKHYELALIGTDCEQALELAQWQRRNGCCKELNTVDAWVNVREKNTYSTMSDARQP